MKKLKGVNKIRKQLILLSVMIIFALSLSSTVSANDLQIEPENQTTNGIDPIIKGTVMENNTPAEGATITVKDPTTNMTIITGTTNSTGEYKINFISNQNTFKLEITYKNYKPYTTIVECSGTPPTAELNHTFVPSKMLKPIKMLVFVSGCPTGTVDLMINDVYKKQLLPEGYDFDLEISSMETININSTEWQTLLEKLKTTDIFFYLTRPNYPLTGITYGPSYDVASDFETMAKQMKQGSKIFLLGAVKPSCNVTGVEIVNLPLQYGQLLSFLLSKENIKRTLLEILREANAISISQNETKLLPPPGDFLYHPDYQGIFQEKNDYIRWYNESGHFKEGAPWIGITIFNRHYMSGNLKMWNEIIKKLESKGFNVIPYVMDPPVTGDTTQASRKYFLSEPRIDLLITSIQFGYGADNYTVSFFKELNAPVLSPTYVFLIATLDKYLQDKTIRGLSGLEIAFLAIYEAGGRIEPILIGGTQILGKDPDTGLSLKEYSPYEPGLNQLIDRVCKWIELKYKPNNEKRVALIYYDSTHDEKMLTGYGLNVPASIANVLQALLKDGYNLGNLTKADITTENILRLINAQGRNLINYTQADLLNLIQKGVPTVTKEEYLQWYYKLPESLRKQVEATWGPPPGNIMVYKDKIVLPGLMLGNIFLGVQPRWVWNGTLENLYNNTLPPTHQYIAFYLWLQNKFQANAIVHVGGQHGTLELLPGHLNAMTADDWPNTLIGNIPNIQLVRMDDPGHGIINPVKRRAYGVVISHLTPPLVEAIGYTKYRELDNLIKRYNDAKLAGDNERMELLKSQTLAAIKNETGLASRLKITDETDFDTVIARLSDYIEYIAETYTTSGLHTFGALPDNETLEKFIDTIVSFNPSNRTREQVKNLLIQSVENEITNLLRALRGEYIEPVGVSDPVCSLDVLPTGRNMYSLNPSGIPDIAAMQMGKKVVDKILEMYKESNGKYPETIAIGCGIDVILTGGQSIAAIFNLIGVRPVYESGTLIGTEIIPLEELGRPRIDVMIVDPHNIRSICPNTFKILDNAIRQVALLNESTNMNYVRKHYLAMLPEITRELIAQGLNQKEAYERAEKLARARIFGLAPGSDPHGVSVDRMLWIRTDWTEKELSETYLNYYSYVYTNDISGISARKLLEKVLGTVDTSMIISTPYRTTETGACLYNIMSNIIFATKQVTGKDITGYVVKTNYKEPRILTLQENIYDEISSTLLNREWIQRMLGEGYSGQATIALQIRSLFVNNVFAKVTSPVVWRQIANVYLDPQVFGQFGREQQQIIAGLFYQAHNRGMVQFSAGELKTLENVLGIIGAPTPSIPGVPTTSPGHSNNQPGVTPGFSGFAQNIGSSGSNMGVGIATGSASQGSGASRAKSYEVSEVSEGTSVNRGLPVYAMAGIIVLVVLVGAGYFLASRGKI
ncbi:MAG: cobaltochelatase subunit CobN [Methanothermobacter sp.]